MPTLCLAGTNLIPSWYLVDAWSSNMLTFSLQTISGNVHITTVDSRSKHRDQFDLVIRPMTHIDLYKYTLAYMIVCDYNSTYQTMCRNLQKNRIVDYNKSYRQRVHRTTTRRRQQYSGPNCQYELVKLECCYSNYRIFSDLWITRFQTSS